MAEVYLTPQDVPDGDAQLVLVFLNRARSAKEIADRVEIANETDVGLQLAKRILKARAQQNEVFVDLGQVYAVPLIGPERFTEIVTAITGKTALEILLASGRHNLPAEVVNITRQLDSLRQLIDDLQRFDQHRYHIDFQTMNKTPYLGEIVTLKLRVVERISKTPQVDMPVTLETNWGFLQFSKNFRMSSGTVISGRTGVDGEFTCRLHAPTTEPLTRDQQNELSNAVAKLGSAGLLPAEMTEGFQLLTSLYQHPLNRDLRAAIDIHYQSRHSRLSENVNHQAPLHGWVYEHALVRCYLHPDDESEKSTVLAMAALPLEYRDWLQPWYQLLKDGLNRQGQLSKTLEEAMRHSDSELGLTSHLLANLQAFVAGQNGLVAERAAQQVSEEAVTRFATTDLTNLSSNTQNTLLTLLREAPSNLKSGSAGQLAVANQMAVEVGRKTGILNLAGSLESVTGQIGQMQRQFLTMDTRLSTVETATTGINFNQLQSDLNSFKSNYTTFNSDYRSFQSNYGNFNTGLTGFNDQVKVVDTDLQDFNRSLVSFNKIKDQLVLNVTDGVNTALHKLEGNTPVRVTIQPIADVNLLPRR
jgi:hypothetical protein